MSAHRINVTAQGAKMFLNLDLHSVFYKLKEPSQDPHPIVFVFKTDATCLELCLMDLKELMISVFNRQPRVLDDESWNKDIDRACCNISA